MFTVKQTEIDGVFYSSIRVASINILNKPEFFVEHRLPALVQELRGVDADVILFQEVLVEHRGLLVDALGGLGYGGYYFSEPFCNPRNLAQVSGNGVFSRIPGTVFDELRFVDTYGTGFSDYLASAVAIFTAGGVQFHALSNHFAWGGGKEINRASQAQQVTAYAESVRAVNSSAVVLLGGDLNAVDSSHSVRYLKGLDFYETDPGEQRDMWVDAWDTVGADEDYFTTSGSDFWGSRTARGVGIVHPELIKPRRIDYLMTYGWAYGRPGCPLRFGRFADERTGGPDEISDHYGIYADFLVG